MTASVALPYYTSPNVARVHLVMDITPGAMRFEVQKGQNQKNKLHAEIDLLGIASTPDGGVAARFSDALKFDFDNEDRINEWRGSLSITKRSSGSRREHTASRWRSARRIRRRRASAK